MTTPSSTGHDDGTAHARRSPDALKAAVVAFRADARRFLAQSIAWRLPPDRKRGPDDFEHSVLSAGGVVVRYGQFYRPGTYFETEPPAKPRVNVAEAARRTVPLLDAPSGVVTVDEP